MDAEYPETVERPWGHFEVLQGLPGVLHKIKRLHVNPGARLSLQSHRLRSEVWCIVQGTAEATLGGEVRTLEYGEVLIIPAGSKHRLANPGKSTLIVVEVQTGKAFDEEDVLRFDDDYHRGCCVSES